jgi:hypothetical protein
MKKTMNITTSDDDIPRYADNGDLKAFYRGFGLDGVEVLYGGVNEQSLILPEDAPGVHLRYYPTWLGFWRGDEEAVLDEFGTTDFAENYFGGPGKAAILDAYRSNLTFAAHFQPEYLVFHVSDVSTKESVTRKYRYSHGEVIDASAELLNQIGPILRAAMPWQPALLLENLWWPGFTFEDPALTRRLLSQVEYPNTSIMLDLGHLLHTNTALRNLDQGTAYINAVLDRYSAGDLTKVRGIHLHQTLEGEYVEAVAAAPFPLKEDYWERMADVYPHILRIDSHQPFCHRGAAELVARIAPDYLTLELISRSREELAQNLQAQSHSLYGPTSGLI